MSDDYIFPDMVAAASSGQGNACVDIFISLGGGVGGVEWIDGGRQSDPELVNSQIGKLGDPTNTVEPTRTKASRVAFLASFFSVPF